MSTRTPVQGVPLPPSGTSYALPLPSSQADQDVPMPPVPPQVSQQGTTDERLTRLEWWFGIIHQSQSRQEAAIMELKQAVQPKPKSILPYVGAVITVALFLLTIIWQAAKYPDRSEFNQLRDKQDASQDATQHSINQIQLDQVQVKSTVEAIQQGQQRTEESLKTLNSKLDRALNKGR